MQQAIGTSVVEIMQFRGEFRFLSNFTIVPGGITYKGLFATTTEHLYQAMKTTNILQQALILQAETAGGAKKLGAKVVLRSDWEERKLQVMTDLTHLKFQNSELATKLLNTGEQELIEGNTWGDTFWGVDITTGQGCNNLGKILMKERKFLQ